VDRLKANCFERVRLQPRPELETTRALAPEGTADVQKH
jgi:hypothetical protein